MTVTFPVKLPSGLGVVATPHVGPDGLRLSFGFPGDATPIGEMFIGRDALGGLSDAVQLAWLAGSQYASASYGRPFLDEEE